MSCGSGDKAVADRNGGYEMGRRYLYRVHGGGHGTASAWVRVVYAGWRRAGAGREYVFDRYGGGLTADGGLETVYVAAEDAKRLIKRCPVKRSGRSGK